jgi:UDP-N-acetylmuramoylalanine--D-glutamate ligase
VHLFVGGVGKGSDYQPLIDAGRHNLKAVYVFGEEMQNLQAAFAGVCPVWPCENLKEAVQKACSNSSNHDIFLLSPACASFDQYRSFEERGAHFKSLFEAERQSS